MKIKEEQIIKLMETLDITREEAIETIQFDNEEFELDEVKEMTEKAKGVQKTEVKRGRKPQQKAEGTKMAGVTQQTRKKKDNPTKQNIINCLFEAIQKLEGVENAENPNKEKTIIFELDGNKFEIDLKQKRKPKA